MSMPGDKLLTYPAHIRTIYVWCVVHHVRTPRCCHDNHRKLSSRVVLSKFYTIHVTRKSWLSIFRRKAWLYLNRLATFSYLVCRQASRLVRDPRSQLRVTIEIVRTAAVRHTSTAANTHSILCTKKADVFSSHKAERLPFETMYKNGPYTIFAVCCPQKQWR